jgi:hypothetical protein
MDRLKNIFAKNLSVLALYHDPTQYLNLARYQSLTATGMTMAVLWDAVP